MPSFRRTWLTVDLGRLCQNYDAVKAVLPEGCDIYAVLKANAYGQGDVSCAKALAAHGARRFAMATAQEGAALREAEIEGEILILSYVGAEDVPYLLQHRLTAAAASAEHARALNDAAAHAGAVLPVHLKLNTGMNRIGLDCGTPKQLEEIASLYALPHLRFDGIFSHFSSSDDGTPGAEDYCRKQLCRFTTALDFLTEHKIEPGCRHISNSGAIGKYPAARFDAVRCGALLAGYNTAVEAEPIDVLPAAEWRAAVTCVRTLAPGEAVSYSRKFVADRPTRAATVSVGYADGWPRALSNGGTVLLHGKRARILGNICMDQMMVDVTDIPEAKVGDVVVLIGRDGALTQTADDVAAMAGSCMHEIMSRIGSRVEREYLP